MCATGTLKLTQARSLVTASPLSIFHFCFCFKDVSALVSEVFWGFFFFFAGVNDDSAQEDDELKQWQKHAKVTL